MPRHKHRKRQRRGRHGSWGRAPVLGGPWRLRQLRQFDFGFQYEEEDFLRVVIPLPGVDKNSLKVKAKERLLSISSSVREDLEKYATRPEDTWDIVLEQSVDPETAKAKYVDGVLLVDLALDDTSTEITDIDYE